MKQTTKKTLESVFRENVSSITLAVQLPTNVPSSR